MQLTLGVAVLTVIVAVVIGAAPHPRQDKERVIVKRGFRLGAGDRFSHGFGKRNEDSLTSENIDLDRLFSMEMYFNFVI